MRFAVLFFLFLSSPLLNAQSLGSAGTIDVTVTDPAGAAIPQATVEIRNPLTGFRLTASTGSSGQARLANIPYNRYHLEVRAPGFAASQTHYDVRSAVTLAVKVTLTLPTAKATIDVEAVGDDLLENVAYAHTDLDAHVFSKLPVYSPASGLSDALILGAPGIVADSNGFFHPLGDHAQTSFVVDGQPINDQQSKTFSTQLPLNAIQSLEIITGAPSAEYGDKTSLVVATTTKSGLGFPQGFGSLQSGYGSFGTLESNATLGGGSKRLGSFLALNGGRSGRFLDTPEFRPYHAAGNHQSIFHRTDFQPNAKQALHLNVFGARTWFQVPNTLDQPNQDQRQQATTFSTGLGWQYAANSSTLWSVNPFVRQDRVNYYPSRDASQDDPVSLGQNRHLTNYGVRTDLSLIRGRHNVKAGVQAMQTRLQENFAFEITAADYQPEFDTRRFRFNGSANINQAAVYATDTARFGELNLTLGFRYDRYAGLATANGFQPRAGLSYRLKPTGTVFRAAFSRTFETPYNENLVLASRLRLFEDAELVPLRPGNRNQYNVGFQQAVRRVISIEGDYFWKYTRNAYDFAALLTTPVTFPISWRKSSLDGFSVRVATTDWKGFQAYTMMGRARARFFGPSNGGVVFPEDREDTVFRIDHDQAFQSTNHIRYQRPNQGWYGAYTYRYDSGLVSGEINTIEDALALTPNQQAAIGFSCRGLRQDCFATRYRIPGETAHPDHNPARVAPRHVQTMAVGTDNLWRGERRRVTLRFAVSNLTNTARLYNFLSPFGGTHFVNPRSYSAHLGFAF